MIHSNAKKTLALDLSYRTTKADRSTASSILR
jgi:hypothetical protein